MRKSRLMLDVQSEHPEKGKDIQVWFPKMVEELGAPETARQLGIGSSTVPNWLEEMGYACTRKVVPVGQVAVE